jgi:DNA polymerase-3 subunit delta
MPPSRNFTFICGQDDFLVGKLGRQRFEALAVEVTDDLSRDMIGGFAANVAEVEAAVNRFRDSLQTIPMFGGRRVVWLRDVNFLADTPTGRAESTLSLVEDLKQLLANVKPEDAAVLITASPVDRRRSFLKWCEQNADFVLADGDGDAEETLVAVVQAEARALGASFGPGAVELLLAKVGANTRLLVEETRKLASYACQPVEAMAKEGPTTIAEAHVAELTPNVAEGDFFEAAEAFFSGDLSWTLGALHRHFFAGGDARPMIVSLQNRNRLLLQMRALVDAGEALLGPRGLDGLSGAAAIHGPKFAEAAKTKSSYNIFAQHPFYLGKLAGSAKLPSLRRLIDNQQEFIAVFEEIIRRPDAQEEVLRDMAVRCLAAG